MPLGRRSHVGNCAYPASYGIRPHALSTPPNGSRARPEAKTKRKVPYQQQFWSLSPQVRGRINTMEYARYVHIPVVELCLYISETYLWHWEVKGKQSSRFYLFVFVYTQKNKDTLLVNFTAVLCEAGKPIGHEEEVWQYGHSCWAVDSLAVFCRLFTTRKNCLSPAI